MPQLAEADARLTIAALLLAGGVLSEGRRRYGSKDVWMCSIPAVWCWLLWDAAKARHPIHGAHPPIFAYLGESERDFSESRPNSDGKWAVGCLDAGLPILQYVHRDDRTSFLEAFVEMGKSERNILAANNAYLAEEACRILLDG